MSVAKVSEISATSKTSFEDAIQLGLARANTIRKSAACGSKSSMCASSTERPREQVNIML
jgi:hypothetical protein